MGIFSDNHYHRHDNSTHIRYPDTIKEVKAPTDESIRLLNEFQEKALDNLISKVEVNNNLIEGTVMAFDMAHTSASIQHEVKIICKFKINGQEFVVEKGISRDELWKDNSDRSIAQINLQLNNYANSVLLWFMCKKFVEIAFKQITNQEPPNYMLR
jgi:hypothetical protein